MLIQDYQFKVCLSTIIFNSRENIFGVENRSLPVQLAPASKQSLGFLAWNTRNDLDKKEKAPGLLAQGLHSEGWRWEGTHRQDAILA